MYPPPSGRTSSPYPYRRRSLHRRYGALPAPSSLLSIAPGSSILNAETLRSFKLALLKGRDTIPATLSPPLHARSPISSPASSVSSSSDADPSPARLGVTASLPSLSTTPLPAPSSLKRSFSLSSFLPSIKRVRCASPTPRVACSAIPLPSADVKEDAELAAFWIARELVEFASRYDIVEGEDAGSSKDTDEDSDDEEGISEEEDDAHNAVSVRVFDDRGLAVTRWVSASELESQRAAEVPAAGASARLADPHQPTRPHSVDANGSAASQERQRPPVPDAVHWPVPSLSAEEVARTLHSSFSGLAKQQQDGEQAPVRSYAPHPLTQRVAAVVEPPSPASSSSMSSALFSAVYAAPALISSLSSLMSSAFDIPSPSSSSLFLSATPSSAFAAATSASFSYPAMSTARMQSSSSLYPPQASSDSASSSEMAASGGSMGQSSMAFASPSGLYAFPEPQLSTLFSL